MSSKEPAFLQKLRRSLRQARVANNLFLVEELQLVLMAWPQLQSNGFRQLTRLLQQATDHITKQYVADALVAAQDLRAVPALIRAAKQPENSGYNAAYFWACEHYDCSAHLPFFVQFLLQCQDPGEAMMACVAVIEAMRGPFEPRLVKRAISKLLQGKRPVVVAELQLQHELFLMQAGYALLDTYFEQVNQAWKTEAGTPWTFYEGLNQKRDAPKERSDRGINVLSPDKA